MKPMPPFGPRARWKAVAITAEDPAAFAQEYETTMNSLVSDGWNITGLMNRGNSVIVTAQKPDLPTEVLQAIGILPKPVPPVTPPENATEEVIYTYKDEQGVQTLRCAALEEAVTYLEEHIEQNGVILPISIVVMHVTSYEPADLPLLRDLMK